MSNALLWLGGMLVAALCALFAVPHVIDWNRYRGVFEEEASRMLGREVRVDGKVNLRLLPTPFVQFDKIHVADGEGAVGEPFIRAESFTIWLAVGPLLRGAIQANEVALNRPVLKLRTNPDGTGNWQGLALGQGSLPYMPSDVSLQSIRVSNGALVLSEGAGREVVRFEAITGEASASALEGPYKFRADLSWNGEQREIKGATSKPETDGAVRVKLAVRVPRTGSTYALDGRLSGPTGKLRLGGELTAKIPLQAGSKSAGDTGKGADSPLFDLKSQIEADATGARLPDVVLSFEQGGRPQSLSGRAEFGWRGNTSMSLDVAAKWLDLDRVATHAGNPGEALRDLVLGVVSELPTEGRVAVRFGVDQANLGGEAVSNARFVVERAAAGPLLIKELAGALPGGSRFNLQGALTGARPGVEFNGEISLRGASLVRLLNWLHRGQQLIQPRGDGAFGLRSNVRLTPASVTFSDSTVELGNSAVSGGLSYTTEGRRTVGVTLDGSQIDISAIAPRVLSRSGVTALLGLGAASSSPAATPPKAGRSSAAGPPVRLELADTDVALKIRAGQLFDGERRLKDVTADIRLRGGNLLINELKLATEAGLQVEAEGEIKDATTRAKGQLRGVLAVASRPAFVDFAQLLELADDWTADTSPLAALAPGRVAYDLLIGERKERGLDARFDGQLMASGVRGLIRLDAGLDTWRSGPVDATVEAGGIDLARAMQMFSAPEVSTPARAAAPTRANLLLRAKGASAGELQTFAQITAAGLDATITGRASLADPKAARFAGDVDVAVTDLQQALAAFGLKQLAAGAGVPLAGTLAVDGSDGKWSLEPRQLAIGGTRVSGKVTMQAASGRRRFDGRLAMAELQAPALLAPLLDGRGGTHASGGEPGPWPSEPFDFTLLAGTEGRLRLEIGALKFADAVALRGAILDAELAPERVEITRFEGAALGGIASGTLRLDRVPGGAQLTTTMRLAGARLDAVVAGEPSGAAGAGKADLSVVATGRAASPRSLLAAMSGKGEVQLSGGRIGQFGPAAVGAVADASLAGKIEIGGEPFRQDVAERLLQTPISLGRTRVPLEIADGALKFRILTLENVDGRVTNQTIVDLAGLKFDSEWRIEPKATGGKPALPGVAVIYVGGLGQLGQIRPSVSIDALERELKVRKMERDVDALEKLRRDDEERSRVEAERRAALQALDPPPPLPSVSPPTEALPSVSRPAVGGMTPASGPIEPARPIPSAATQESIKPPVTAVNPAAPATAAEGEASTSAPEPRRRAQSAPAPAPAVSPAAKSEPKKPPNAIFKQLEMLSR